jgi:hypothetical protein
MSSAINIEAEILKNLIYNKVLKVLQQATPRKCYE